MRKITALILFLTILLLLPAASFADGKGTGKKGFVIPQKFDEEKNYEITFWAKNDTNIRQVEIYNQAIAGFEALYPNIKVNIVLYTDYTKIYQDVITNIATDTTPNVCITYPDNIATYLSGENVVVSLDGLMADKRYGLSGSELKFDGPTEKEIIDKFLDECRIGGQTYALPFMRSTEACYVNKDFVEKLGYTLPETLTWDFVWEVSEKALEKDDKGFYKVNGQKTMIPFIYKSTDNMMIQMLAQKGYGYSDKYGNINVFNDNTKSLLESIAPHAKSRAFSTFKISSYPGNFLNAGQCIFAIDSTAGATWMGSKAPLLDIPESQLVEFETVVMTIPQFDQSNPLMISQGPSVCVFNKDDPEEVLASWLFTQYLLTNDVQIAYSETEGYVPVTAKAQNSEEYKNYLDACGSDDDAHYDVKIKAAKLLLDNTGHTFVTPVFNGSASLRTAAGQMIEEVVTSVRRNVKVDDEYYETLYNDMVVRYKLTSVMPTELQTESIVMLCALGGVWACLGVYFIVTFVKKKKAEKAERARVAE